MSNSNRNRPCPCGSGKKYKKCCGGTGILGTVEQAAMMPCPCGSGKTITDCHLSLKIVVKRPVFQAGYSQEHIAGLLRFFPSLGAKKPIRIADERTLDPRFFSGARHGLPDVTVMWFDDDTILIDLESDWLAFMEQHGLANPLIRQQNN